MIRFIVSLVTVIVLIAIDNQAAGPDGLINYGDLMRLVVWAIVIANVITMVRYIIEDYKGFEWDDEASYW